MNEARVAIILINYNNAVDTLECLESLKNIEYKTYSIFVVDNGSDNETVKILREFDNNQYKLIELQDNNGFSAGNNVGIEFALKNNFDYILLLNNDTMVTASFLNELIKAQEEYHCAVTTSKIYYASDPTKIWYAGGNISPIIKRVIHYGYGKKEKYKTSDERKPKKVNFASGCCMCISADTFHDIGKLDEDYFLYDEDTDFCLRINAAGKSIYYVPSSVIYHKVNASTGRGSPMVQYYGTRNRLLLISKNYQGLVKIIAYLAAYIRIWKKIFTKEFQWQYAFKGIKDFLAGEVGKNLFV